MLERWCIPIQDELRLVEKVLAEEVTAGIGTIDRITHYVTEGGGKRIRPALCLLTCEALGGRIDDALPFAAGVELLHNMLLLHDDIEDGDEVRRDQPTVWKRFGVPNAINAGDYQGGVYTLTATNV